MFCTIEVVLIMVTYVIDDDYLQSSHQKSLLALIPKKSQSRAGTPIAYCMHYCKSVLQLLTNKLRTKSYFYIRWKITIWFFAFSSLLFNIVATPTITATNGVTNYVINGEEVILTCTSTSDSGSTGAYEWKSNSTGL